MSNIIYAMFLFLMINCFSYAKAGVVIDGPNDFKEKVEGVFSEARRRSVYLAKLIQSIERSSSIITIKAITNDPATWHKSGKKSRSHTEALDGLGRGVARNKPTSSVVYINKNRITFTHKTYKSGTLLHELAHASDLANGRYHGSYPIREKRAVFFQNIWRSLHSKKLRVDYHGRFKTNEYQRAKKTGQLNQFVKYYFTHNNIPDG